MGYSVLIVDDERIIREGLKRHIGWAELGVEEVRTAESAESALLLCREHMPDLLVTDICMGGRDGLDLAEELSGGPDIIIISSYDDFRYAQRAVRYPAVREYVLKPIDPSAFRETVSRVLAEREAGQAATPDGAQERAADSGLEGRGSDSRLRPEARSQLVRACLELAASRYADRNFGLAQAAEQLEVTPNYLSGRFKEETGTGFTRYLLGLQIDEAKRLLLNPVARIYQIAEQVGFSNEKYFSRQFKHVTGMTPKEWRNRQGRGEGE